MRRCRPRVNYFWLILSMLLFGCAIAVTCISIINAFYVDQVWGAGMLFGAAAILYSEECLKRSGG